MSEQLTFGSLFAGIGGFDLGLEAAGMRPVWQVERDAFARSVLSRHWPGVTRKEDVRNVGKHNLRPVKVICGGFPCQDISCAGAGEGLEGERSGLWAEFARVIGELRPDYAIIENSPMLLARGGDRVLCDLAEIGYDAEWEIIPACWFGAPHERARLYIISYPHAVYGSSGVGAVFDREAEVFGYLTKKCAALWLQAPDPADRVANGVPGEFYRLAVGAYGNAIVPVIAEFLGRLIQHHYRRLRNC